MKPKGLRNFFELLKDLRHVSGWLVKGALATPIVVAWIKVGPPPSMLMGLLATCAQILTIITVFDAWNNGKKRRLQKLLPYAILAFFVTLFFSTSLLYLFSYVPPGRELRIVEGFVLRNDIKEVLTETYTAQDALRDAEYDPYQVWQNWSVVSTVVVLCALWTFAFSALATALTIFVLKNRDPKRGDR
jgi:hypothetical protein